MHSKVSRLRFPPVPTKEFNLVPGTLGNRVTATRRRRYWVWVVLDTRGVELMAGKFYDLGDRLQGFGLQLLDK